MQVGGALRVRTVRTYAFVVCLCPSLQLKMPVAGEYEFVLGSKKTDKTVVERFRLEPKFVVGLTARTPLELTVTRSAVNLLKSMVEVRGVGVWGGRVGVRWR